MYEAHIVQILQCIGYLNEVFPALSDRHCLIGFFECIYFLEKSCLMLLVDHTQIAAFLKVVVEPNYVWVVKLAHDDRFCTR